VAVVKAVTDLPPDGDEFGSAEPEVSVAYLVATLREPAGYLINAIAQLEAYPIATATPRERSDLLDLRDLLEHVNNMARMRMGAIDLAFKRAMEELGSREIPVEGWGPVRYAPDEGEWEVHSEQLLEDFRGLVKLGVLTKDDIDKAFTTTVQVKVDNRVLNGLMKRGTAVTDAIDRNRSKRESRPLAGHLTLPKRRRPTESEE